MTSLDLSPIRGRFGTLEGAKSAADVVRRHPGVEIAALGTAFAAAVAVRIALAGPAGPRSVAAGLAFAAALTGLCVLARTRVAVSVRGVGIGLVGAAVLLVPVAVSGSGISAGAHGFLPWAVATTVVATAEEAFLRGALFDAVARWPSAKGHSNDAAVVVGAVAFAALHLPLYGWHAVPLDLAVGLVLGAIRLAAGTWTAPAVTHVVADLAGWWLP